MFSIKDIWKILEIIQKNQAIFIGTQFGREYLSPYDIYILEKNGINMEDFDMEISDFEKSFYFGMIAQKLGGQKSYKIKKDEFEKLLKKEIDISKRKTNKQALKFLKERSYNDLSGLGNKIQNKLSQKISTVEIKKREKIKKKIQKKVASSFKEGKTKSQLASELKEMTEDWARDFSRVADYVMQEAYGFGRAQQIIDDYGEDALVYKQTFPGVCDQCEKNYGTPRMQPNIYKISELLNNGNNIGRKEQLPVVGPAHPWARSILHVVPKNSEWDKEKGKFVVKRNTQGIERKSKIKVTITR